MPEKCVVLLSGGQDSATCLLIACDEFGTDNVQAIAVDYGQRHRLAELQCAAELGEAFGVKQVHRLDVMALAQIAGGALTSSDMTVSADAKDSGNVYAEEHNLPSTFVPGRNMVLLSLAAGVAARIGAHSIYTGGCLDDYEGYPDCRPEFYEAAQMALRYALDDHDLSIRTPLVMATKAQIFEIAAGHDHLDTILEHTHTCYHGNHVTRYEWGYGCGECPACLVRANGFAEYLTESAMSHGD